MNKGKSAKLESLEIELEGDEIFVVKESLMNELSEIRNKGDDVDGRLGEYCDMLERVHEKIERQEEIESGDLMTPDWEWV